MQALGRTVAPGRAAHRLPTTAPPSGPRSCARRRHPDRRSDVVSRAEPTSSGDVELWELHEELLREIQERKQQQARLLEQLNNIGPKSSNGSSSSSTVLDHAPHNGAGGGPKTVSGMGTATKPSTGVSSSSPMASAPAASSTTLRPPSVMKPPPAPAQEQLNRMLASRAAAPAPAYAPPQPQTLPPFASDVLTKPIPKPGLLPPPEPAPAPVPVPEPEPEVVETAVPEEPKPPPLAGTNVMNVVMVGAECAPWSKTGGLGDVMGALPKALARRGHRVMVVAPRYDNYDNAWETGIRRIFRVFNGDVEVGYFHCFLQGVDYVFVDHPCFHARKDNIYGGERSELQFRCALLCKAALEAVWHVPCGGILYGDNNTVYIANDWHTALLPVYLQAHYRDYGQMTYSRSLFVIHNMAHQGRGPFVETEHLELNDKYREQFRLFDPIGGEHMNIMKAGLQTAHSIVAVSEGYAWECTTQEGGWGLDKVINDNRWKLRGIVNGIDYTEWSPEVDKFLTTDGYCNYNLDNLVEGKRQCKLALQKELGLPQNADIPLLGFIGRLDYQKGIDLIRDSHDWLMGQGVQLVLLGSGREDLESDLRAMESRFKQQTRGWVGFSVKMAHRITAGCDVLLMPSRFEPCGLNQLYAMAYGTPPVVHAVGGLRDTVKPYNPFDNTGTGWTFERAEGDLMRTAIGHALVTYRDYRDSFVGVMRRDMQQDLSWDHAAELYEQALIAAKYQW